jgi:hypothetical protein
MINLKPKAKWRKINHPLGGDWYVWGAVRCCVAKELNLWHISISCEYRYPTWDEIYTAWYDLVPGAGVDFNGAIILPRKSEYVNIHPNCFHVYQLLDSDIPGSIIL